MKLKKCILSGVLAASMLCESLFGVALMNPIQVYAAPEDDGDTGSEDEEVNLAKGAEVRVSGVKTDSQDLAKYAVDGDADTQWSSVDLRKVSPQWLQIDLESPVIDISRIEVVFGDQIWDQSYEIWTYDAEKNARMHKFKTVGTAGPNVTIGSGDGAIKETRDQTTKTDTILRNDDEQTITVSRYLRFNFTIPENLTGTDEKCVSIAEIRIYGIEDQVVHGPQINLAAPVTGQYPEVAEVLLPEGDKGVYHTTLKDLAYPAATLIRQNTGNRSVEQRSIGEGTTQVENVSVNQWTDGTPVDLTKDEIFLGKGKYGFNAPVQTPGTNNKFDVWGHDIKIVSCQVYFKEGLADANWEAGTLNLFGYSDKMAVQLQKGRIQAYMHAEGNNVWPTEAIIFGQTYNGKQVPSLKDLEGKWHDLLIVVDGKNNQRLYFDGICAGNAQGGNAIPREEPEKGLHPFTFGFNYADGISYKQQIITTDQTQFDASLKEINKKAFTSKHGYFSRFDFYTNKSYHNFISDTGNDISDAAILSDEFKNFNVAELETAVTAAGGNKNDVYTIITNMLQKEPQTGRISICPYKFNTIWSKKVDNEWVVVPANEKFAGTGKYKATITLQADEGFVFDRNSLTNIENSWNLGEGVIPSVRIFDKRRQLEITAYYGCEEDDVEEQCRLYNLVVASNPIRMVAGDSDVDVGADMTMFTRCGNHQKAELKFEYKLSDNAAANGVTVTDDGKISATKSTRAVIGYEPITLTVTAKIVDENGETVKTGSGAAATPVEVSKVLDVEVDPSKEDVQIIDTAPAITAQSPVINKFPQVVDIALPQNAVHFADIDDRMSPSAVLEPLTTDYINTSEYLKNPPQSYGNPTDKETWLETWNQDAKKQTDRKYENIINNVDGVIGFNVIGQTSGNVDKFDVFGDDIKLVSFKLYLKKWPINSFECKDDGATVDIYGKGNKYAIQLTSNKKLIMYMQAREERNGKPEWPQQEIQLDDTFLGKWHNIFMVVDGKGWQRLYVDGKRSTTRLGEDKQGGAFAKETSGYESKPFTLGYNSKSNHPSWYDDIFTNDYGYIADFEFYSDKNYSGVFDGDGIDISEASRLTDDMAKVIDLEQLETDYADNLDDIGTILTNLLQESNATACITATPYVTKTNWSQKQADGTYKNLDKVHAKPFTYSSSYCCTTTLTAYEGFKFANTLDFKENVKKKFHSEGDLAVSDIDVKVEDDAFGNADRILTITVTYTETDEAPCTCELSVITPLSPVEITIPAGAVTAQGPLTELTEDNLKLDCLKGDHINPKNYKIVYALADGSNDLMDVDLKTMTITAKKAGDTTVTVTAQLMQEADKTKPYLKGEEGKEEEVKVTVNIPVTITRADAAQTGEKTALSTAVSNAERDYPNTVEDDYEPEAWNVLQDAINAAKVLAAAGNKDATSSQVETAGNNLTAAIEALKNAKSAKGLAKDELKEVLDNEELKALLAADNKDKKYTAASWQALKDAYQKATDELGTADAEGLGALKTALETAWKTGLVLETTSGDTGTGTGTGTATVKDGDLLTGADKTQYKVASAKDKTVIITKGVDAKSIKIGPTVTIGKDTYKVIGIGNKAYTGLTNAAKVVIDANVTSIGDEAFSNCKKLKNVTIGQDVVTIGKKAFFKCPKLAKVTVKNNSKLSKVLGSAFKKTSKNIKIKLPKNLKKNKKLKKQIKKAGIKKGL